jgi:hypothetical protein
MKAFIDIVVMLKKLHFHRWEYTPAVYADLQSQVIGLPLKPAGRSCSVCGKVQVEEVHCLGLNPPQYTKIWFNRRPK